MWWRLLLEVGKQVIKGVGEQFYSGFKTYKKLYKSAAKIDKAISEAGSIKGGISSLVDKEIEKAKKAATAYKRGAEQVAKDIEKFGVGGVIKRKVTRDVNKKLKKIKSITGKGKKVDEILAKAGMVETLTDMTNTIMAGRVRKELSLDETVKDILKLPEVLALKSEKELNDIIKALDKNLEDLGLAKKQRDDIGKGKVLAEKDAYKAAKKTSYETYMQTWKYRFLNSGTDKQGKELDEEEKQRIWDEIESKRTYRWFVKNKINKPLDKPTP